MEDDADRRLRDSEALLDRAGRLAGVGGWSLDLAARTITWNAQACRLHDVPAGHRPSLDEALGFVVGGSRPLLAGLIEHASRTGAPFDVEVPIRTARAQERWLRIIGEAEMAAQRPLRLFGAMQDITARHRMEQTLANANLQLRQLYEQTPALLMSIDSRGTMLSVSDLLLGRTGFDRSALLGRRVHEVLDDRARAEHGVRALFETGRCDRVPYRLACRDGRWLDVFMSAIVERTDAPEGARALAAFEDVTAEVARTEELEREHALRLQLERRAEELKALLAERGEMLDLLAHEVRQPLNNASAALQSADAVLAGRDELGAAEQLRRAQDVIHAVISGVDNTLAVSSLLSGDAPLGLADVDVDMLIRIAVADMAAADRARIRVVRETAVRTVAVDAALMRMALRNLLANALAYSPPEADVDVLLLDAEPPEALRIDVIDRGRGIEPAVRARLFERGARTRRPGERPSHGLGLYIARRAMELQGGAVSLVATGAQGTHMRLHLREAWADDRD